jgi:hypothetical protein
MPTSQFETTNTAHDYLIESRIGQFMKEKIEAYSTWINQGSNAAWLLAGAAGGLGLTAVVAEKAARNLHKRGNSVPSLLGQVGLHVVAAGAVVIGGSAAAELHEELHDGPRNPDTY